MADKENIQAEASNAKVEEAAAEGTQAQAEDDPLAKQPSHYKRPTIFYSRIWTLAAAAIILLSPLIIAIYYHAGPNWAAVIGGLLAVVPIYWPVTIIEQFSYTPLLGPSSTMLSLVTGNLTNMKIPAALSAMEEFKAKPGSEKGKIICLLACSTCAIVSIVVCALGVAGLSFMKPVLDNPSLSPAFSNLLPALFGSLSVTFIKKNWKIAIFPCTLMVILFICFPFLSSLGGLMIPIAIVVSIASSRIMFKSGILTEQTKTKRKHEVWAQFKAFIGRHRKVIRMIYVPTACVILAGVLLVSFAGQFNSSGFVTNENGKPVTLQKYMSEVWFDKNYQYDYFSAHKYAKGFYPESTDSNTSNSAYESGNSARCTSLANNGIYGHNYDWVKDDIEEFVVHVEANGSRHASVGVASSPVSSYTALPTVTANTTDPDAMASIPFCVVDGINDQGVYCALNRSANYQNLNSLYGVETKQGKDAEEIYAMFVPRYVLDQSTSADDAIAKLADLNIVSSEEKVHFMIGDSSRYYVVEVSSGRCTILVDNVMTNFDLSETNTEIYSTGIERYDLAKEKIRDVRTVANMEDLLKECYYSKVFDNDTNWYSDLYDLAVDNGSLAVNNNMSKEEIISFLDDFKQKHDLNFRGYKQNADICSVHSSIYDSSRKTLRLLNQEGLVAYEFSLSDMTDDGTGQVSMFSSIGS